MVLFSTYLCDERVEREGDVAAEELKSHSHYNFHDGQAHPLMVAFLQVWGELCVQQPKGVVRQLASAHSAAVTG